jgi:hypothetical protein
MLRKLVMLALLSAFLALPTGGCAAIAKALPYVITGLVEAGNVLDSVEAEANVYFAQHPDADRKPFDVALAKTRQAFAGATHAARGADDLTQQDVDAGFADFVKAYNALIELAGPLGIVVPAQDGVLMAPGDGGPLRVPTGEQLVPRVE